MAYMSVGFRDFLQRSPTVATRIGAFGANRSNYGQGVFVSN